MLQLTSQAAKHLISVRDGRGLSRDDAVRIVRNGARVGLTFARKPEPDDRADRGSGSSGVSLSRGYAGLEDTVIDARPQGGETVLVIRRQKSDRESPATD